MRHYLFAFDFKEKTMSSYIVDFLEENEIDYFFLPFGTIAADLFGTGKYYRLDIDHIVGCRKEVYYRTDKIYTLWDGMQRIYPMKERALVLKYPCYKINVYCGDDDYIVTLDVFGDSEHIFEKYVGNTYFCIDGINKLANWVEFIA